MPLIIADQGPLALRAAPNRFLVFYSSPVNGELWCPDCRAVEHLVKDTFTGEETPDALIVHVGDRSQWKVESNPYRKNPWHLTNIPTIIKLDNVCS